MKVAINGFGRIGRLTFRKVFEDKNVEVVAINDLAQPEMLAHLLKYDSVQGPFSGHRVESDEDSIIVDGKKIPIFKEPDPANLPWGDLDVDIVLECTGFFASKEKSMAHIDSGAKKVIISAPAGNDIKTIVYGVNHHTLSKDDVVISGASCTTNCLAPMAKVLNEYRELRTGFMTTIHAYTGDQMILDGPHRKNDFRRARAGAINIVPNSTGAAKAIGLVIPELHGKLIGSAQRVPVPSGSITILDATLKDNTETVSVEGINAAMKAAANESFGYTEEELVSSDTIGMSYGSLFDATQTLAQRCGTKIYEVRVVAWYDNEMSYVNQLIRTMKYFFSLQ
ncbi:MAG: type I glyceraldehyde-3-phosphate dehydrogenase [Anaerovoracaceae bacterium]|jgi:glyceraldehyde 3-phosphate dehydrogenase